MLSANSPQRWPKSVQPERLDRVANVYRRDLSKPFCSSKTSSRMNRSCVVGEKRERTERPVALVMRSRVGGWEIAIVGGIGKLHGLLVGFRRHNCTQ